MLDALIRGHCRRTTILSDPSGVRGALQEYGARRAGQDYSVEPVAVDRGVFHPKISLLFSGDEAHCLVGSGNLTFSGWGFNLELVEHLHSSFAGAALRDVAEFFLLLGAHERVRFGANSVCESASARLDALSMAEGRNDLRFLHNLEQPIAEQIVGLADELGGASGLTAAAPYWDHGAAIGRLGERLGLGSVRIHNPPGGSVRGTLGRAWPEREAIGLEVEAVRIDALDDERPLHGKAFEILCARGAILVSGSPNATSAALEGPANIEAALARVEPGRGAFWSVTAAEAPLMDDADGDAEGEDEEEGGVLRADFEGDVIRGQILTRWSAAGATFSFETRTGRSVLGEAPVKEDGCFAIAAGDFEAAAWMQGRRILHAESDEDGCASGFVQISAFSHIVDRAGVAARHMFAAMAGMESPADIKAIIAWFSENPDRLASVASSATGASEPREVGSQGPEMVSVAGLQNAQLPEIASLEGRGVGEGYEARFLRRLLEAFRGRTEPIEPPETDSDDEDEEPGAGDEEAVRRDYNRQRMAIFDGFEALLTTLLERDDVESALIALDIGGYLCATLDPDPERVVTWLRDILASGAMTSISEERRDELVAATLLFGGDPLLEPSPRLVRRLLHGLGHRFDQRPEEPPSVSRWRSVMPGALDPSEVWRACRDIRTHAEQAQDCARAIEEGRALSNWNEIGDDDADLRKTIEVACTTSNERRRVLVIDQFRDACPCGKYLRLPSSEMRRLKIEHVARSGNCCGRVIVWAPTDE